MSLIFFPMSIGSMLHVDFKKWPCRLVNVNGQWPHKTQGSTRPKDRPDPLRGHQTKDINSQRSLWVLRLPSIIEGLRASRAHRPIVYTI